MKPFKYVYIFVLISTSLMAQNINVSGNAFLKEQSDHSGIKVYFEPVSPSAIEDSAFTNSAGAYSKNVAVGIYNVHFLKDGYQPKEIPNQFFSETTVLPDVTMPAGTVVYISGNVSGFWITSNIYVVTGDISVPAGDTLTLQAGTQVKFDGNYLLTVSGCIFANGEPGDSIIFTSNQSVPMPGDWGGIVLNYAPVAKFNYIKYLYASNGINGYGNQSRQVTITNSRIENLHTDAYGVKLGNQDNQNQCYGTLILKYNSIKVAGDWVVYSPYAQTNGQFTGNKIISTDGAGSGLYLRYCTSAVVDSNEIVLGSSSSYGIYGEYSTGMKLRYNSITGYRHSFGMYLRYANNADIRYNSIDGCRDYGFFLESCSGDTVIGNKFIWQGKDNKYSIYGFYLSGSSNHFFQDNFVSIENTLSDNGYNWGGFRYGTNHIFKNNHITIKHNNCAGVFGFSEVHNSLIADNYIEINSTWANDNENRYRTAIYGSGNTIENDTIILGGYSSGIWGNNLTIKNVVIDSRNSTTNNYGIYLDGSNNSIDSVKILNTRFGIYMQSASNTHIRNNTLEVCGDYGIHVNSNSTPIIFKNSILGKNTGTGIKIENNSTPFIRNNHIQDFTTGISGSSLTNVCQYNNLYNVSTHYAGSGLPPNIGMYVTKNNNGTPSDIYWNINQEPRFFSVNPNDSLYLQLMGDSPLINAGYPDSLDIDGTVSDIGTNSYFHHLVIKHNQLKSTNDTAGPYNVEAKIYSPQGDPVQSAALFYSIDGGTNYAEVAMAAASADTFQADIPGQALNTSVNYYIQASDGIHTLTDPFDCGAKTYSFFITMFSEFANLSGTSKTDGSINLIWNTPVPISGTLTGFNLYRSLSPGVPINSEYLYTSSDATATSYTDINVEEAVTYYYKLTGIIDDNGNATEVLASSEIGVMSDDPTVVRVRGVVTLQGETSHTGTKIFFEKTSPSAVSDSAHTNGDGYYDIIVVTGIYNVHFTHDGYQPQLLGHQFFSDNAWLDTLTLVPGGVVSLAGEVSGDLTSNNLYFVDGNVTIPYGDTLTINAGTQVLFRGNYTITANGKLFVNGTPDNKVIFSSRMPVPAVGDWNSITLNSGATGSVIKYAVYKYATDGFICNNLNTLTIWGCEVNTLAINARAITLNNCENVDIRYNTLNIPGDWVIYKSQDDWDNSGIFIGNNIQAANSGMYIRYFYNLTVDSNTVQTTGQGIRTDYSRNMLCRYNTIAGQDHSIGIHAYNCDGAHFIGNNVNGARSWGYYLHDSQNIFFTHNNMIYSGTWSDYKGIYTGSCDGSLFEYNKITYSDSLGQSHYCWGFYAGNNSTYKNNRILIWKNSHSNNSAFQYINNSHFEGNYVLLQARGGGDYERSAFAGNGNTSINDTLIIGYETRGYYGSNWTIQGSIIQSTTNNNNSPAIDCRGGVLSVDNVTITGTREGIYGTGVGGHIKNTLIDVYGSNYGVKFENNSTMKLYKNTIVGNNAGTGIWTTTNAAVTTNSNIIDGFTTGLNAESPNTVQTSLFYDNTTNFTGSELPPQVGAVVTVNSNADPSDIYGNIFLNPQFVSQSTGDYHLLANSPAINAGDIDSLDLDGSVADIGVYFYNFGYIPKDLAADSTGNGFVSISWDIITTDSLNGFQPYYKLSSAADWTASSQTTEKHATFTGLTNNTSYDFVVSAIYPVSESKLSKTLTTKAGLPIMQVDPRSLIVFHQSGNTSVEQFTIRNTGSKDLEFNLTAINQKLSFNSGSISPGGSATINDTISAVMNGVNIEKIFIYSNDPVNLLDSISVLNAVGYFSSLPSYHFDAVDTTAIKFYAVVEWGNIDGESLQTGDEIALFDGDLCVGAAGFNGNFPFVVQVFGADGALSGFTSGDSIIIKLWDASRSRYATATVTYSFGDGSFWNNGFAKFSVQGSIYRNIFVPITANRFNLISSYLYPKYPNVSSIFGNLTDLKIVYEDNGRAYIPQYGINTIGDMDITEGYHVFVAGEDKELSLQGMSITPQNWQITLNKNQFNSISYLYDAPMSVEYAFADIASQIEIVQDDDGGAWIPSMGINTIGDLQPLSGYQVFTNSENNVTFTYPYLQKGIAKEEALVFNKPIPPSHFQYTKTGLPYTVVITAALMDNHPLENGDEVGIFYNEICVGATVWDSEKVNFVTAWKGSEEFNVPGFRSDAPITFKAFSKRFNSEFDADAIFQYEDQKYFEGAAYSIASLKGVPGLIPDKYVLRPSYPNPFNAATHIVYDVPDNAKISIMIYNILGKEVTRLADNEFHVPGKYNVIWNGTDKFGKPLSSGLYFVRMTGPEFHSVHKIILMK